MLTSSSANFSAGLDLSELTQTSVFDGVLHSRGWHAPLNNIQLGTIPVVSVLRGAVIGGGLELALATHIRVAEPSAYYALPEGSRGIFVGGGASVRLPRLIGAHRMADMMLTGRVIDANDGLDLGISQYLVGDGEGFDKAIELANRIAENNPVTNYAVLQALPRIAEMGPNEGLFVESLMAAICQGSERAKELLDEFLSGRAAKVVAGSDVGEPGSRRMARDEKDVLMVDEGDVIHQPGPDVRRNSKIGTVHGLARREARPHLRHLHRTLAMVGR